MVYTLGDINQYDLGCAVRETRGRRPTASADVAYQAP